MKEFLRLYAYYIKIFLKSKAEYRVGFFLALLSNAYSYVITYVSVWVIIQAVGTIAGWNRYEITLLYALNLLSSSLASVLLWYNVFNLSNLIVSGELDVILIRPRPVFSQLIWQRFGDTALAQVFVSIIFVVVCFANSNELLTGFKIIYTIIAIISGAMIQSAVMIVVGTINFWTIKSNEIGKMIYYDLRSLAQYPLDIYPKCIKYLLTFALPWAFVNYYPALIILGKGESLFEKNCGLLTPVVGIILLIGSIRFFQFGLKNYMGIGG